MKEKMKLIGIIALAAVFALGMMGCEVPCEHTDTEWTVTATNSWEKLCTAEGCGEVILEFSVEDFYGIWVAPMTSPNQQEIDLKATQFKISNTVGSDSFTLTNANWLAEKNGAAHAASKEAFPIGFAITGTSAITGTGNSGTTANPISPPISWFANNTNAGVYINEDGTKIVVRLTNVYMPQNGSAMREYTFDRAN